MNEITVWSVLEIIGKRFVIILLAVLLLAGATFAYFESFVDPTYAAASSILTSNGGIVSNADDVAGTTSKIGSADVASSLNIMDTYVDILKTYAFYDLLSQQDEIESYGLSAAQLQRIISIKKRSDLSLFVDITVTCKDPQQAIKIANLAATVAPEYIESMLSNSYVKPADRSRKASLVGPMSLRNAILVGIVGFIAVVGFFILRAATDTTVKGEKDIIDRYNIAVLGIVPDFEPKNTKGAKQ